MSKSRDESRAELRAKQRVVPNQYPNLVGDGFCENPRCIIRWNGHEFGSQPVDGCFVQSQVRAQGGSYPLIDAMLVKLAEKRKKLGLDMLPEALWEREH